MRSVIVINYSINIRINNCKRMPESPPKTYSSWITIALKNDQEQQQKRLKRQQKEPQVSKISNGFGYWWEQVLRFVQIFISFSIKALKSSRKMLCVEYWLMLAGTITANWIGGFCQRAADQPSVCADETDCITFVIRNFPVSCLFNIFLLFFKTHWSVASCEKPKRQ